MTRQEFLDDVTTWSDLEEFCNAVGVYDELEDVYDTCSYNEAVEDDIREYLDNEYWYNLSSYLDDLPSPRSWDRYIRNDGWLNWTGTDDGDRIFCDYKERVLDVCDEDCFDSEDEEELEVVTEESSGNKFDFVFVPEDFSVDDLIGFSLNDVVVIEKEEEHEFEQIL